MARENMTTVAVPEELLETAESRHFEGEAALGELAAGADAYRFAGPVTWSVEVTNTGGALLVMGDAKAAALTACARCLEDVTYELEGDIEGYFIVGGEEGAAPDDLEGDEFEYLPENRVIDMTPLIEQALLLELPLVPLCADDCRGICPRCGANLNEGPCSCAEAAPVEDGPFAALRNLKLED